MVAPLAANALAAASVAVVFSRSRRLARRAVRVARFDWVTSERYPGKMTLVQSFTS
jgi:hypothetical protein